MAKKPKAESVWGWGVEWELLDEGEWRPCLGVWPDEADARNYVHLCEAYPEDFRNARGPIPLVERKEEKP